jgi:hypothetical protein
VRLYAYTARLGRELADRLRESGKERDRLREALTKNFKAMLKRPVADLFVLEITPKTRQLHMHAAVGLHPDEEDAAKEAISKSVGGGPLGYR